MKKKILSVILTLTLCAGLSVPALAARTFTDVPSTYWAYDAIQYVVDEGLFQGTSATTFEPGISMTRAMLIQVLYRYAGSPQLPGNGVFPYQDVSEDAYYRDAAYWGRHRNIFASQFVENCDTLRPNEAVTRGEFAVMLWKFAREQMGYEAVNSHEVEAGPFTDMDDGDPGVDMEVQRSMLGWAYPNGILSGTTATTMSPNAPVTRAQVATMLMRYATAFGDGQTADPSETTEAEEPEIPDVDYKLAIALMNSDLTVGDKVIADMSTIPSTARHDLTFTFKSSNTSVATVEAYSGNHFSFRITAVGPGTAVITATDSNGVTATRTVTVTGPSTSSGTSTSDNYADIKDEIVALTNEVRAENDAGALSKSDLLMQIAQQRAEESAEMQVIDHGRPNGDFFDTIFAEYGLDIYSMNYQEILGWATILDANYIVDGWEHSTSGHFGSMTNPNMIFVGVGVAKGDHGRYYYCQIFTNKDRT